MQNIIFPIIFVIINNCPQNGLSLIVFDKTYGTADIKNGRLMLSAYLKYINAFDSTLGGFFACDFDQYDPAAQMCDYAIFSRMCLLLQNYMGKRKPEDYSSNTTTSFIVDSNEIITIPTSIDVALTCNAVSRIALPSANDLTYEEPNLLLLTSWESKYTNLSTFSGDLNYTNFGPRYKFGIFVSDSSSNYINFDKHLLLTVDRFLGELQTTMREQFILKTTCGRNYAGKKCWYRCTSSIRMTCKCTPLYEPNVLPCQAYCNVGWLKQYKEMQIDTFNNTIVKCDSIDVCINKLSPIVVNCPGPRYCLPVDNNTYYCEYLQVRLTHPGIPENISTEVLFYEEFLEAEFDSQSIKHKDILDNFLAYLDKSAMVFYGSILSTPGQGRGNIFQVVSSSYPDKVFYFSYILNLKSWERTMSIDRYFRIYVRPTLVKVYRFDNNTPVNTYIHIGEFITGKSDAAPQYRLIILWKSKSVQFGFPFGDKIQIPPTALPGISTMNCSCILITKGRNITYAWKIFTFFVKLFEYLEWNNTDNVINDNTAIACLAQAYVDFRLSIIQLLGPSQIKVTDNYITVESSQGGSYEFVCYFLSTLGFQYSSYLNFKLRVFASQICFFLYANIAGSIVQCSHNGFLQDEYETTVSYYKLAKSDYELREEGRKYLRIPYNLEHKGYKVICKVKGIININISIQFEIKNELSFNTRHRYIISESNKICLRFDSYVEMPTILKISQKGVTLAHLLFHLHQNESFYFIVIPICLLMSAFPFIATGIITDIASMLHEESVLLKAQSKKKIRKLRIRALNDRLRKESRYPVALKGHEDFYKESFINKRVSVIQMLSKYESF